MTYSQKQAEILALEALEWLAKRDDLLMLFLGETGAGISDMKSMADDPVFLGSVLDFIMMNDPWVIDFINAYGHPNEAVLLARQSLPGGDLPNWT